MGCCKAIQSFATPFVFVIFFFCVIQSSLQDTRAAGIFFCRTFSPDLFFNCNTQGCVDFQPTCRWANCLRDLQPLCPCRADFICSIMQNFAAMQTSVGLSALIYFLIAIPKASAVAGLSSAALA